MGERKGSLKNHLGSEGSRQTQLITRMHLHAPLTKTELVPIEFMSDIIHYVQWKVRICQNVSVLRNFYERSIEKAYL